MPWIQSLKIVQHVAGILYISICRSIKNTYPFNPQALVHGYALPQVATCRLMGFCSFFALNSVSDEAGESLKLLSRQLICLHEISATTPKSSSKRPNIASEISLPTYDFEAVAEQALNENLDFRVSGLGRSKLTLSVTSSVFHSFFGYSLG